jgi:hypothetical protein
MVTDIKLRGLEWLGHLIRMEDNRIPKIVLDAKLNVKRKVGRPKLEFLDDVQKNLKITGIGEWRRKAQDRLEWMNVIREASVKVGRS